MLEIVVKFAISPRTWVLGLMRLHWQAN